MAALVRAAVLTRSVSITLFRAAHHVHAEPPVPIVESCGQTLRYRRPWLPNQPTRRAIPVGGRCAISHMERFLGTWAHPTSPAFRVGVGSCTPTSQQQISSVLSLGSTHRRRRDSLAWGPLPRRVPLRMPAPRLLQLLTLRRCNACCTLADYHERRPVGRVRHL
jgi:hypothetical protein